MKTRNTRPANRSKAASENPGPALPRYVRLPPQGEVDPWSGLSRGKINELILPTDDHPVPPVKSIKLPNRGKNKKGVRLVVLDSLLSYLKALETQGAAA